MSRSRGKSACGMGRHIWEPKWKRKQQARRLTARRSPGARARPHDRCRHTVICAQQGSRPGSIRAGGSNFRLPWPRQTCLTFSASVWPLPPCRFVVLRQAEIAHAHALQRTLRRAAGPAEPMGPDRVRGDHGGADGGRSQLSRHFGAFARGERTGRLARLLEPALLRVAHGIEDVCRARRLARVHLHLCDASGQEPAGGDGADPGARHPAVGADPGLSVVHRDVLSRPLSRKYFRRGTGRDLCDLHQPGLEHGLFPLPVAADRPARSRRSGARVPPDRLAEILAARSALRDAGPHLEHDDVDVGRLVLRRRLGGDHGRRHDHHPARGRLLHRQGERRRKLVGDRRGDPDDGDRHSALRPAVVPANRRLGRQVQGRTVGERGRRELLGAEPPPAHLLDPARRSPGVRRVARR